MCIYLLGVVLALYLLLLSLIHRPERFKDNNKDALSFAGGLLALCSWGFIITLFGMKVYKRLKGK